MDWEALGVSLRLAAATAALLTAIGLPLAYWLAFSKCRFAFMIDALVMFPFVIPPTVLGLFLLVLFAKIGHGLAFSFAGLLVGSVIFNLPIAIQPFRAAISMVDRKLLEASWSLGWSKCATFFYVILPISWAGLVAGCVLSFAHTLGEFGVAMMVGGNLSGSTRTIAISIYDDSFADFGAAEKTAILQLGVSFILLIVIGFFSARSRFSHVRA